jgi:hypothetical protein
VTPCEIHDIRTVTGPWYVAHLHGSRETDFRDRLCTQGHTVYLPMREVIRRESKGAGQGTREVKALYPLFPAYAFVAAPGHDAVYAAKATNLIWSLRPVVDQSRLVVDLYAVQCALDSNPRLGAQRRIPKGTLCEVQPPHAMRGMRGVVADDGGAFCLVVQCLGSSVPVEIDPAYLEPV